MRHCDEAVLLLMLWTLIPFIIHRDVTRIVFLANRSQIFQFDFLRQFEKLSSSRECFCDLYKGLSKFSKIHWTKQSMKRLNVILPFCREFHGQSSRSNPAVRVHAQLPLPKRVAPDRYPAWWKSLALNMDGHLTTSQVWRQQSPF